jgi:two-component system chemotaxis response regulator CheB
MWEIDEGDLIRYRCHQGHAYTAELMSVALDENVRRALASAQRALEERTALAEKLHKDADQSGHPLLAKSWAREAQELRKEANVIRDSISRVDEIAARLERE